VHFSNSTGPRGANYGDPILRSTAMRKHRRSCILTSYYLLATSTAGHALAHGRLRADARLYGPRILDSDTWIFPAVVVAASWRAKSLAMFRAHTLPAAQARAQARGLKGACIPGRRIRKMAANRFPIRACSQ